MARSWGIAPAPVRRLYVSALVTMMVVSSAQAFSLLSALRAATAQFDSLLRATSEDLLDPQTLDLGSGSSLLSPIPQSPFERFMAGFSLSMPASFATLSLVAACALLRPYRNRWWKTAIASSGLSILLAVVDLLRAFLDGNAVAGVAGSTLAGVYASAVLVMARHPVVRAWSVRFEPPPPVLPGTTPDGR